MDDSKVIPFPAAARVRVTPLAARLRVLELAEPLLYEFQRDEQIAGRFDRRLSLVLDWLSLIQQWERAA